MEFGGDHRYVAEYLSHEVLGALDDEREWFLLRVAVLGRFTAGAVRRCSRTLGLGADARRARGQQHVRARPRAT